MNALRVEPGNVEQDGAGDLTVDAHAGLHVESGVKMRIDGLVGGEGRRRGAQDRDRLWSGGIEEARILNDPAHFIDAVVVNRVEDVRRAGVGAEIIRHGEAVVEEARPGAKDGFGLSSGPSAGAPGD